MTNLDFATQLAALLHLDAGDTSSLQSLVESWNPTTPADLANSVTTWVSAAATRDAQYNAWAVGTATGGPNGDGTYPINIFGGGTISLPCPAKLLGTVTHGADAKTGISFSVLGPMNANELLAIQVTPGPLTIDTLNIAGFCFTTPTADTVITVKKNGAAWGTVTFKAGQNATITQSFSSNTLLKGDAVSVHAPASPDATFANFALTLPGVTS